MVHEFDRILSSVREWAGLVPFPAVILRGDGSGLRIIWETKDHLTELIVCRGEFVPYRYVSFLILDARLEADQEPVYSWQDREDSSPEEILGALDRGIAMMKERVERDV